MTTLVLALLGCGGEVEQPTDALWGAQKRTQSGKYLVSVRSIPDPAPLGELFAMEATVTDPSGAPLTLGTKVTLDARMPQHNHGMETKPMPREQTCEQAAADPDRGCPHDGGIYVSDGFKFHMAGAWTVTVDVEGPVGLDSTSFVVDLPSAGATR